MVPFEWEKQATVILCRKNFGEQGLIKSKFKNIIER